MSRKAIILYLIFLDYYIIYDIIMLLTWILLMQLSSTFFSAFIFLSAGTSMINMLLHRMMHDLANKHLWYNIFVCLFMTIVSIWHKHIRRQKNENECIYFVIVELLVNLIQLAKSSSFPISYHWLVLYIYHSSVFWWLWLITIRVMMNFIT